MRTMVVRLLGTLGEVTQAQNGAEALAHLKAGGVADLIVTDVMMPQMDGLTLSRELKKDPALARIPILMLTAKSSPSSMIDGINAGARQYLTKPFKADDLLALLLPHTGTEEDGLFVELRAEGSLTAAVEALCAEHVDIHGVLGAVDRAAPDWPPVLAALRRLRRHIDNEEHGLFPAAVVALPIDAWDRVTPQPEASHQR